MNNIEGIRQTSKALFDTVKIVPFKYGIVQHPFVNSMITFMPDGKQIATDSTEYRKIIFDHIDHSDATGIYMMLCDAWLLTWLKFVKNDLDRADFSSLLGSAWVTQDNPNMDSNVSVRELAKWFKEADKKSLMTSQDYDVWKELPPHFSIYRGVGERRNTDGLSWTMNYEKARWFMNRWQGNGYMLTSEIDKSEALAFFNTRNEVEIVVDTLKLKKQKRINKI